MKNIIKKVTISGFRSIENQTIHFGDINIFSGKNDSGKSNVLRALNLFFNSQTDFLKSLKFSEDYNKVSFARATMSAKMKQQIKIRVHLNVPPSYNSLKSEHEVFLERAFDRNGERTEKYSNDKKKAQITRLINSIKYIYIPALKGENVLQYLLALIGEFELIDQGDIEAINKKIAHKTSDLTGLLKQSNIPIGTSFGLPTFLADFWQKLSVETAFDEFKHLTESVKSKSDPSKELNPSQFRIPLNLRGEGVKSKYIPPLLLWLGGKNQSSYYIWGIDEPENSLEFGLSSELANLYFNEYGLKTQIFLTSHSLAFINPPENIKSEVILYRCIKSQEGTTTITSFDNLFAAEEKLEFYEEIGALEVQKQVIMEYRRIKSEKEMVEKKFKNVTKPIVLTEGKTDAKLLRIAWNKLHPHMQIPFEAVASGIEIEEEKREGSADQVRRALELSSTLNDSKIIIGLFDNDREGNEQISGLNKKGFENWDISQLTRKHKSKSMYGLLLPCPPFRTKFITTTSITQRYLQIEHYFEDSVLSANNLKGDCILGTDVFEINKGGKTKFAEEKANNLSTTDFENFKILFQKINELIAI